MYICTRNICMYPKYVRIVVGANKKQVDPVRTLSLGATCLLKHTCVSFDRLTTFCSQRGSCCRARIRESEPGDTIIVGVTEGFLRVVAQLDSIQR